MHDPAHSLQASFRSDLRVLVGLLALQRGGKLARTPHARRYTQRLARARLHRGVGTLRGLARLGHDTRREVELLARIAARLGRSRPLAPPVEAAPAA